MDSIGRFKLTNETSEMLEMSGLLQTLPASDNASGDFFFNTIMNFFNKVGIDGIEIQNDMPIDTDYPDTLSDIVKLINLQSALSSILKYLFIKDFKLNDLINPAPKRINKCLRYLSNFLIYYTKTSEIMDARMSEIYEKRSKLEKLLNDTRLLEEETMDVINKKQALLRDNEKLLQQIEKQKAKLPSKSKQKLELQKLIDESKERHEKNKQAMSDLAAELLEIQQNKAELEKKLVKSPSKIVDQLNKLNKQKTEKMKEVEEFKEILNKTVKQYEVKKETCENMEHLLNQYRKCGEVKEEYLTSVKTATSLEKNADEIKEMIEKARKNHHDDKIKDQLDVDLETTRQNYEKQIEELLAKQLYLKRETNDNEKEKQKMVVEDITTEKRLTETQSLIAKFEKENDNFVKENKERFTQQKDEMIKQQSEIQKQLTEP